ncbi:protein MID1-COMPLEMENTING ACTIVITY 1 [Ricinus communis]|uniref:protein MID1-COMPLEMENTING ACTIVITY 1 n=1 Tax=Ricinus communis TaxID=3988 RepID=UPI000772296D|nr:protein MID1-COMPLEMENTING ACTIVITY 1 [Ricinus communis]|eukprot:XP_015575782.1 protein MID1-COMPLEMENTING ACTIVITY 1 isoform X1 [Ricinus communis]
MASIAQVAGVDATGLANMIISAARNATTHRKNCEQLAEHVKLIGNLLEKLKSTDLMNLPATKEPLDGMEEALRKALDLVESCKDKSYLYMLALGWNVVYQFKQVQAEIDRYLKLVPLISLVHEFRMQNIEEGLQAIEGDHREYTLEEEDIAAQSVILKPDRTRKDANILEKSLSRRYPELEFLEALQEEKEKLHIELQRSRTINDTNQCRVIEHLIDVTENVVNAIPEKKVTKLLVNEPTYLISGYISNAQSSYGDLKPDDEKGQSEWQVDLFDCCKEPCLSLNTCIYPCGTFSRIANLVSEGEIPHERAVNDVMAYAIFCGCCCYTCCFRRRIRQIFDIEGGACDDFLTHLMCCCCAMVQELRELEVRGFEGCQERKMIPPPYQYMNP